MRIGIICFVIIFCFLNVSHAHGIFRVPKSIAAGVRAANQSLYDIEDSKFDGVVQKTLDALVKKSIAKLRKSGFSQDADQFEYEWVTYFANGLSDISAEEIGDHQPLSLWLVGFYNQLEKKLGFNVCHFLRLDDIKILNYGIPVTIHPEGHRGETWDIVEYRKHFVPVSAAIVYWTSDEACTYATTGLSSLLCGQVGEILRAAAEKFVSPKLSNYVYKKANGESVPRPKLKLAL